MADIITNFTVEDDKVYLCYYDASISKYIEFTGGESISIPPLSASLRRFYIVSNKIRDTNIKIGSSLFVSGIKKYSYISKLVIGREELNLSSFKFLSNHSTALTNQLVKNYDNAVSLDVYLSSNNICEEKVRLNFSITVEDSVNINNQLPAYITISTNNRNPNDNLVYPISTAHFEVIINGTTYNAGGTENLIVNNLVSSFLNISYENSVLTFQGVKNAGELDIKIIPSNSLPTNTSTTYSQYEHTENVLDYGGVAWAVTSIDRSIEFKLNNI